MPGRDIVNCCKDIAEDSLSPVGLLEVCMYGDNTTNYCKEYAYG